MADHDRLDRITVDPHIMQGRACIRGMRITGSHVVKMLANGMPTTENVKEYAYLEDDDLKQALLYASALANDEIVPTTPARA